LIAIVDKRIPLEAKVALQKRFLLFELESKDIVYPAISGHPDIFIYSSDGTVVIAPNSPQSLILFFERNSIPFIFGEKEVGFFHPETSHFNAISTSNYLIHNSNFTDTTIKKISGQKEWINVQQSYTRCNVISLKNDVFITSDKGIYTTLTKKNISTFLLTPKSIVLEGFEYGFIGGCAGVLNQEIYFIGNLDYYVEGVRLRKIIKQQKYQLIELYDGPLFDGGGIIFVKQ
jgi:hypothetical protein